MKLRLTYGVPVAALVLCGAGMSVPSLADPSRPSAQPTAAAVVRLAEVTTAVARLASSAEIVASPSDKLPSADAVPAPPPHKPRVPAKAAARHPARDKFARVSGDIPRDTRRRLAGSADGERKTVQLQPVGPRQVGCAAWYGGRYVGRQTSSGERLDRIHATAAHRTLPLNSLARVTNLDNGRSVIVRITDRGPVSHDLLIDMSPKAADQLAMKHAGIVRVAVEQVVEVPSAVQ